MPNEDQPHRHGHPGQREPRSHGEIHHELRRVNLNTADQKEIEDLPMVGPKRAEALIWARPLKSWEERRRRGLEPRHDRRSEERRGRARLILAAERGGSGTRLHERGCPLRSPSIRWLACSPSTRPQPKRSAGRLMMAASWPASSSSAGTTRCWPTTPMLGCVCGPSPGGSPWPIGPRPKTRPDAGPRDPDASPSRSPTCARVRCGVGDLLGDRATAPRHRPGGHRWP